MLGAILTLLGFELIKLFQRLAQFAIRQIGHRHPREPAANWQRNEVYRRWRRELHPVGYDLDPVARAKSENRQANVRAELSAARCRRARGTDHASYATRLVRLAFLAPDIVTAILAGKQPPLGSPPTS
jgi:hypothetical protein